MTQPTEPTEPTEPTTGASAPYRTATYTETETEEEFVDKKLIYWSRAPGRFVNMYTGKEAANSSNTNNHSGIQRIQPLFHGTLSDWYETLVHTIHGAAAKIEKLHHQKPTILEVSPDILTVLACTGQYKNLEPSKPKAGAIGELVGTLAGRYFVHVIEYGIQPDLAKLVLVSNHEVSVKPCTPRRISCTSDFNRERRLENFQSSYDEDWVVREERSTTMKFKGPTRLDGITIKVLDL